jgi:hypothetical protein
VQDHVLTRRWFTRVWILQELVMSCDPWIQIGVHRLRWNIFVELTIGTRRTPPPGEILAPPKDAVFGMKSLMDMQELRNNFVTPPRIITRYRGWSGPCDYLLQILHSRCGNRVFDARDMLYAHLGMFKRNQDTGEFDSLIRIDYHKPLSNVYTDLVLYLL